MCLASTEDELWKCVLVRRDGRGIRWGSRITLFLAGDRLLAERHRDRSMVNVLSACGGTKEAILCRGHCFVKDTSTQHYRTLSEQPLNSAFKYGLAGRADGKRVN